MSKQLIGSNSISINAPASKVWDALVNPEQTKKYMYGCETISDWEIGSPLIWQMQHEGKDFVAVAGKIIDIKPEHLLIYTTVDPNAEIEEMPENHLVVTYVLSQENEQTLLSVTQGDYAKVNNGEQRFEEKYVTNNGWEPLLIEIKKLIEETN